MYRGYIYIESFSENGILVHVMQHINLVSYVVFGLFSSTLIIKYELSTE